MVSIMDYIPAMECLLLSEAWDTKSVYSELAPKRTVKSRPHPTNVINEKIVQQHFNFLKNDARLTPDGMGEVKSSSNGLDGDDGGGISSSDESSCCCCSSFCWKSIINGLKNDVGIFESLTDGRWKTNGNVTATCGAGFYIFIDFSFK